MSACIKNWSQRIIGAFLILTFCFNANAQEERLEAELAQFSGLHSNAVRCMKIDKQGRVWIGTDNGLNILNANTSVQNQIINLVNSKSIWAIDFLDSLVFIGTRNEGLYVLSQSTGKIYKHYPSAIVNLIRKIKIFNGNAFILSNDGPYKWDVTGLHKLGHISQVKGDFMIDVFSWGEEIYGIAYPSYQIVKLKNNSFALNEKEMFFGKGKQLSLNTLFCAATYKNKLYLGSIGTSNALIICEKDKPPIAIDILKSLGEGYAIWDIAVQQGKIILAVGDTYSNNKGQIIILDTGLIKMQTKATDYVTCITVDSVSNSLYYGTLNKGLYLHKAISANRLINNITEFQTRQYQTHTKSTELWSHIFLVGDTLIIANENKLDFYSAASSKLIYSIPKSNEFVYNYMAEIQFLSNSLFTFDSYGRVYQYNLNNNKWKAVTHIESFIPYPQRFGNKIILLNREKGFNLISEDTALSLACSDKSVPFVTDFTLINDTLYTLTRNTIKAFRINYKTCQLIPIDAVNIKNVVEGFAPKWILSNNNKLYLSNDKGILRIAPLNGQPLSYYYFGNYPKINKPVAQSDSLSLVSASELSKISFTEIDNLKKDIKSNYLELLYPKSVNENLSFNISVSYPEYLMQNRFLKSLEIWDDGKLKEVRYSITSIFSFDNGLKYGDYNIKLKVGGAVIKRSLDITLPLNRNPYFFGAILVLIILMIILFVKSLFDKRELNKKLLQNRLQILKQNLNPHFVFNSMNLISSLILEEKYEEAVQVISDFSTLQRTYLETNNKEAITLQEELNFLNAYLKLQKQRFHHDKNFSYTINVSPETDLNSIMVPPLFLQPVAENAIKYGIVGSSAEEKWIRVDVSGRSSVIINIEDNGRDVTNLMNGLGLGHKLVQERVNLFAKNNKTNMQVKFGIAALYSRSGYRVEIEIYK